MNLGRPECSTLFVNANRLLFINARLIAPLGSIAGYVVGCVAAVNLTGCAAPLLAFSSAGSAAASSAGTAAVTVAVANPSTAASVISTATTGKSPLEHAASVATKQDCNFLNALGPKPICSDIRTPAVNDKSELYQGPADLIRP